MLNILRWQFHEDAGKLLKWLAASFFINLLLLFAGHKLYADIEGVMSYDMGRFMEVSLCFSVFQMAIAYALTRLAAPKVDRQRRVAFMMLPASHAAKFWMRVLFLFFGCGLVWTVGFLLADAAHLLITNLFFANDGQWATPVMMENFQRTLLPAETPRETVVSILDAVDKSMATRMTVSPDSIQAMRESIMGVTEKSIQLKSFSEAGWTALAYGVANLSFWAAMSLLCGALFRNVPWVFAFISSFVLSALFILIDYVLPLGMGGLAILLAALTVIFICIAYNIFKKTQVINNKLLNV